MIYILYIINIYYIYIYIIRIIYIIYIYFIYIIYIVMIAAFTWLLQDFRSNQAHFLLKMIIRHQRMILANKPHNFPFSAAINVNFTEDPPL